ncbi:MAG: hypothetical protein OXH76_08670 [Boseongicola sp.]|nr:hypothetical protein [Boseongicola sp.]MDE0695888.1 hypothetical protein [Boseongicola sp.]
MTELFGSHGFGDRSLRQRAETQPLEMWNRVQNVELNILNASPQLANANVP